MSHGQSWAEGYLKVEKQYTRNSTFHFHGKLPFQASQDQVLVMREAVQWRLWFGGEGKENIGTCSYRTNQLKTQSLTALAESREDIPECLVKHLCYSKAETQTSMPENLLCYQETPHGLTTVDWEPIIPGCLLIPSACYRECSV